MMHVMFHNIHQLLTVDSCYCSSKKTIKEIGLSAGSRQYISDTSTAYQEVKIVWRQTQFVVCFFKKRIKKNSFVQG